MIVFKHEDKTEKVALDVFLFNENPSLEEVFHTFQCFIKGIGYELPEGVHVGFEED